MLKTQADPNAWIKKHLGQLVGGTVTSIAIDDADEYETFTGLIIKLKSGKEVIAWIMMDPEGNGPGHLDITPR